jgi:acetyl esterase/lipase
VLKSLAQTRKQSLAQTIMLKSSTLLLAISSRLFKLYLTMINIKKKSLSSKALEGVLRIIRFKEKNSYENFLNMRSIPKPPTFFFRGSEITSDKGRSYSHWNIVSNDKNIHKFILYFHGGAYVTSFSMGHWFLLGELYRKALYNVLAPDYPLAPGTTADLLLKKMRSLYFDSIEKYGRENIILMGDSAGAGLALALSQSLKKEEQPVSLYLLSPWLDLSMENPEIKNVDDKDPILNIQGLKDCAKAYAGSLDLNDPRVSPLYGKLDNLPPIKIYTGTHDILMPDCRVLRDKLERSKSIFEYHETENMQHCGMLYPTKEGRLCLKMIKESLTELSGQAE